jgi:hypothetical protein
MNTNNAFDDLNDYVNRLVFGEKVMMLFFMIFLPFCMYLNADNAMNGHKRRPTLTEAVGLHHYRN